MSNSDQTEFIWEEADCNRLACTLCPRRCRLKAGQHGFCFVRYHDGKHLRNISRGKTCAAAADPVEKKPLYHFYPGSQALSFGTLGCNMGCRFCQNDNISKNRQAENLGETFTPEQAVNAARRYGCKVMAFTYNDPVIWADYAMECAVLCRQEGIKTAAVTAGYINEDPRRRFFSLMDAANIDLKSISADFYRKYCLADIKPVLDTIKYVHNETDCWLELTTLLIPKLNDSEEDLDRLIDWILSTLGCEVPLHFSAFHPAFKMSNLPPARASRVKRAAQRAKEAGLKYVYTGNIKDPAGQSTYCGNCGQLLISRDWYKIKAEPEQFLQGLCHKCGSRIPGRF